MKILLILFAIFSLPALGQNKNGFEIKGHINNAEGKKIFVAPTAQAIAIDSAIVRSSQFVLKGKISETDNYALLIEGQDTYLPFILSNDKIWFEGDANSLRQAMLSGSKELEDAKKLKPLSDRFSQHKEPLSIAPLLLTTEAIQL
jgi:hypothetical protein